ncbi:MAG: multiheme c-type cytochrome [Bacteriovoracaceae bacterium]
MKSFLLLSFLFASSLSCSRFVGMTDQEAFQEKVVTESGKSSAIVHFSHNINGELYPCGCRHFPLGGLPQVAGALAKSRKENYVLYVDTGDTLFPSTVVPDALRDTLLYNAENLVQGLSSVGLKFFVPGDQDFAMGEDYLSKVSLKANFTFLVSNLVESSSIKHKKWATIELPHLTLYFIGLVDPSIYPGNVQHLFTNPEKALQDALAEIPDNKNQKIFLLSHAGMDKDTEWAKKFPRINWVIGAHTQNFLREPYLEGTTKLVQTLSKNHYLGSIQMDLGSGEESYNLVEIRDELKDELKPNPFSTFLDQHKAGLREVQTKEQSLLTNANPDQRSVTANNCFQCHADQNEFWQKTSHSNAFGTLLKGHEEKNTQCVGCHSLKFGEPTGFSKFDDMLVFKDKKNETRKDEYWKAYLAPFQKIHSVRSMKPEERSKVAKDISKLDQKFGVTHNYAGVQCLNCHDQTNSHPFDQTIKISKEAKKDQIKTNCMNCHTPDQSPEWYTKNSLNESYFNQKYKTVSCPKRKEYE